MYRQHRDVPRFRSVYALARTCSSLATLFCSPCSAAGLAATDARSPAAVAGVGGSPWFCAAPDLAPPEPDLAPQPPDAGASAGCRAEAGAAAGP